MHDLIMFGIIFLTFINLIFIITLIFFERKNPASTWAWLLILVFLPIIGFIIYLLLGQDMSKEKRFKRKILDDSFKNAYLKDMLDKFSYHSDSEQNRDIILMNYKNAGSLYTQNNSIKIIFDGKELFSDMLSEIKNAKSFIHMQFYIFRSDSTGAPLLDALCEKAKEGIEVKLQVDAMGNKITKDYIKKLKNSGVEFEVFFPSIFKIFNLRFNYRNHRKFLLIDGNYGYLGGFNIGKEYASEGNLGYWRDTHLKISGQSLNELEERFLLDWTYSTKEEITAEVKKYFKDNRNVVLGERTPMQIVSSGPDHEREHIKNAYTKIINNTKERICIQSPYFVPDTAILDSLKLAILSGIEVNIMLPGNPDHFFIPWVANSYIEILLEYGANVYFYKKGFIHAKTMVSDSSICSVGTANMDIRSFSLNFETNAIIYSSEKAKKMEAKFMEDLKDCKRIYLDEFKARPKKTKFMESICRLLSPIM